MHYCLGEGAREPCANHGLSRNCNYLFKPMSSWSTAQAGRTTKAVEARRPTGTSAFTFNFLSMKTLNLGYPRIGSERELKWASEAYWAGKISLEDLIETGKELGEATGSFKKNREWI